MFLLIILAITAIFILLLRLIYAYLMKIADVAGSSFQKKLQNANFIAQTGMVPPEWAKRVNHKQSRTKGRLAKLRVRRKLSRTIAYFRHTSLVQDEQTRQELLRQLRSAQQNWRNKQWPEIAPSDKPDTGFPFIYNN